MIDTEVKDREIKVFINCCIKEFREVHRGTPRIHQNTDSMN